MVPAWSGPVYRVGLTGAIGSGKSTAARFFSESGAVVIDADRLAKEALSEPGVQEELRRRFAGAFEGGVLVHKKLADIVFEDPARLSELTSITHPLVRAKFQALVSAANAGSIVVYDVPLLFEAGLERDFDLTVCVTVDEALRHRRLIERGLSESDIKRREGLQLKPSEKEKRAGFLLKNNGAQGSLADQVARLMDEIRARRTV